MKQLKEAFLISFTVIALDHITKYLALTYINPYDSFKILPFLHLVFVTNKGAAFGMFRNIGGSFFIAASVIAIIFVVFLLIRGKEDRIGLSLILGGAIGNLIDRILYGQVIDFIDLSIGKYHWPAFNIADSALSVGVTIILLGNLLKLVMAKHAKRSY
jgi:signal peptidase II